MVSLTYHQTESIFADKLLNDYDIHKSHNTYDTILMTQQ